MLQTLHEPIAYSTAVPNLEFNEGPLTGTGAGTIQPIKVEIIKQRVEDLQSLLLQNAEDVVEEGGADLSPNARLFVMDAAIAVLLGALRNPVHSTEDLTLTPFAREDGGAYLLVDFAVTGKRLTVHALPSGNSASISFSPRSHERPTEQLSSGSLVGHYLGWLTKR